MKKLFTAVLVAFSLAIPVFGQSAASVLASLRIKGATSEGGNPKYSSYIPRLDSAGLLDYSFIPTNNVFVDVIDILDERGVKYNTLQLQEAVTNIYNELDLQFARFDWLSYMMYSNAVNDAIIKAKQDAVLMKYINDQSVASISVFTNATTMQIGSGTNSTPGTVQIKGTTVVDINGEMPYSSMPWSVNTNMLDAAVVALENRSDAVSNRVSTVESLLTFGQTNIVMKSPNKTWELVIDDNGNLTVREFNP